MHWVLSKFFDQKGSIPANSLRNTKMKVFGVASFLLLLTSTHYAPLQDIAKISAIDGEKVELYCKLQANSNDSESEVPWFKDHSFLFPDSDKENLRYNERVNESFVKRVIPAVEENDAGLYQCGSQTSQLISLEVLKKPQNMPEESSGCKCNSMSPSMSSDIYTLKVYVEDYFGKMDNYLISIILITLFIGLVHCRTILLLIFDIKEWCEGKCKKHQTYDDRQACEILLLDDLKNQLKLLIDEIKSEVVCKLVEDGIKALCKSVEDDMKADLHKTVEDDMKALCKTVEDDMKALRKSVEDDMKADLCKTVEDDMKALHKSVEDDIKADLRKTVEDYMKADLRKTVEDDMKADLRKTVEDDMKALQKTMEDDMKAALCKSVEDDIKLVLQNIMGSVYSKISKLEGDFYVHQDTVVNEFRRQDKEIKGQSKEIKDLSERMQHGQITHEHGHLLCASDDELQSDDLSEKRV